MQDNTAKICFEWLPKTCVAMSIALDSIPTQNDTFFLRLRLMTHNGQIKQPAHIWVDGYWKLKSDPP